MEMVSRSVRARDALSVIDLFESWGVAVFPGPYGQKGTRVRGWPEMPVADACNRARAAVALGDCNLAARTGRTANGDYLAVIDLDGRDGIDPSDALAQLLTLLPEGVAVSRTGRGFAIWFRTSRTVGNGVLADFGADVFTDAHLVQIPPSLHPSGRAYRWEIPPGGELP
jgi:Bifunctional DNA primase/polymerase, N-terminal